MKERLEERLDYNPETGVFTWKYYPLFNKTWNTKHAGKQAGSIHEEGYRNIGIDYVLYRAGRLAWIYVHGSIPDDLEVDHINRNRDDNRIENLRLVTRQGNIDNIDLKKITGEKYISMDKKKFCVRWTRNGKKIRLGNYNTLEEAIEARDRYLNDEENR